MDGPITNVEATDEVDSPPQGRRQVWVLLLLILLLSQVWSFLTDGGGTWFAYALSNPKVSSLDTAQWFGLVLGVLLALTLCLATSPDSLRAPDGGAVRQVLPLAAVTLAVVSAGVLFTSVWVPQVQHSLLGVLAFVVRAPLAEEMLFRGAVFGLVEQLVGSSQRTRRGLPAPVWVSAAAFGAVHWSYHLYDFTLAAAEQVAYAAVLGLVLGVIRMHTRSIWPGVGLHAGVNTISILVR